MKKNNTAEKTILKAEKVSQALKEGTEKTLRSILNEAVSNAIKDDSDDEDIADDSYTVEDVDTAITPEGEEDTTDVEEKVSSEESSEADDESQEETTEDGEESEQTEEDGPDMEDYNVGDNCYDFTCVEGDDLLKLFKKTGDNDLVFVTKSEDGNYEVKDDETGAEYVIELNPDSQEEDADDFSDDTDTDEDDIDIDVDIDDDDTDTTDDNEDIDIEFSDEDTQDDDDIDISIEDDEDDDSINEEDLGYTTEYQKDVFANKPNMNEPSKEGRDWDKGAPKGSERPYGKIGKSEPFDENLEENATVTKAQRRKQVKTMAPNSGEQDKPEVSKEVSVAGSKINEAKVQKIVNAAKAILAENKNIRKELEATKVALKEAAVSNGAMCSVLNLFINETTTKDEKKQIVERFLNAKTLKDVKTINESVKKELNAKHSNAPILEHQFTTKKTLNETNIYDAKKNPSLNLLQRMDNLWK